MPNIDIIKQEIKEHLERQLLQAYAEGDTTFESFVSGLSEEQKDLLPGLTSLLEAGGNPALVGKGPAPIAVAPSLMNRNPLKGVGGFAGFGGFPNVKQSSQSKISTPNATAAPVRGAVGSPSGPAPVKPNSIAPPVRSVSAQAASLPKTSPLPNNAPTAPSKPNKPVQSTKPVKPVRPVTSAPKPAKAPVKPAQRTSKSTFRNTNTNSIGSHMSRSMGGLGEETHIKESFESFLRSKFLKGE